MAIELVVNALKRQTIFNFNGSTFIGTVLNGSKITESVKISGLADEEASFKAWIIAHNNDALESFTVTGGHNSVVVKSFTEKQLMLIESVSARAAYAIKYAVKELEKAAIERS